VSPALVQAIPNVEAKPGGPTANVCAKPTAPPVVDTRAVYKPGQGESLAATKPRVRDLPAGVSLMLTPASERELHKLLQSVEQVDLDPDYAKRSKADLADAAKKIVTQTKEDADAFVRGLKKDRPELAGLPFLMGKDCTISKADSQALALNSAAVRNLMDRSFSSRSLSGSQDSNYYSSASEHVWTEFEERSSKSKTKSMFLPALRQILLPEHVGHRQRLVTHLMRNHEANSTAMLAEMAVIDMNSDVRKYAIDALKARYTAAEYRPTLLKALRYPWPPIAKNAAQAIVALEMRDAVTDIAAMLDEPDPRAPFVAKTPGEQPKHMVRELVRVNHHRNCMLCHAPVGEGNDVLRGGADVPIGPVTSAGDPLPSGSSRVYYSAPRGVTLVRADVTYLRQDFSVRQEVRDPGKWPEVQRFDFFIRNTEISEKEAAARATSRGISEFHATVLATLYGLTGQAHGLNRDDWKAEAARATSAGEAKPNGR
jgi:hypothetical protein